MTKYKYLFSLNALIYLSLPIFAEPPAESPSTKNNSLRLMSLDSQSVSFRIKKSRNNETETPASARHHLVH